MDNAVQSNHDSRAVALLIEAAYAAEAAGDNAAFLTIRNAAAHVAGGREDVARVFDAIGWI